MIGTPLEGEWPLDSKVLSRNFSPRPPRVLQTMFPQLDASGIALLERLLMFNPLERINARDASLHPFFGQRGIPTIAIRQSPPPVLPQPQQLQPQPTQVSTGHTQVIVTSPCPSALSVLDTTSTSLNTSLVSADDSGYTSMHSQ